MKANSNTFLAKHVSLLFNLWQPKMSVHDIES